jgi:hypothetical protein
MIRTPHTDIFAMTRLGTLDRSHDAIQRRGCYYSGVFHGMLTRVCLPIDSSQHRQSRALARGDGCESHLAHQKRDYQRLHRNHNLF